MQYIQIQTCPKTQCCVLQILMYVHSALTMENFYMHKYVDVD